MTPSKRIREDTARLLRLFLMIDGRLKFPFLFTSPKATIPVDKSAIMPNHMAKE